jgi:hypothetical protein
MITDMNARVAMAQKLSIPQLQQAIKNGTVPAYVGVPMLQDKMRQQQQMQMAQQGQQQQQPPIAEQIMAEASRGGVDQLPSNLPIQNEEDEEGYAGGGIIAFDNGGSVDLSKIPTNELTEDQFNALPESERMRRIYGSKRDSSAGIGTFFTGVPATAAALLGATTATPFLAGARAVLPESVTSKLPTVGDLFGDKGATGILKQYAKKAYDERDADIEAQVRKSLRTHDPVAEGASPGAQEPKFVGGQTGGGAYVGYRKQRTPGSGTPQAQPPALPQQDTSRLAFDYEEPTVLPTTVVRGDSTPEGSLTEGLTPASIRASEDQLPKAIAALPSAANAPRAGTPPAGGAPRAATPATAVEAAPAPKSALDQYADMLMEERKGIAKDRQQAKAMALLQTGLGIAGGTSPNPFANIAQGALQGTQAYQQEMRGIRKEDADRLKQLMSLGIGKEKLALEAKKLGITEKRFDQMYDLETAKLGVMGGQRADSRAQAEELRRLSVAQGLFSTLRKDQLMSGLSDEELWSRAQRMAGQAGTTPVASSGSTVMGSYVPGKGYIPNK